MSRLVASDFRLIRLPGFVLLLEVLLLGRCRAAGQDPAVLGHDDSRLTPGASKPQEHGPGTLHWVLAVVLMLVLLAGLVRAYRVLRQTQHLTIIRHAPEGMRTVECGSCHTAQYVTTHGRIFICCSCHSANRIPVDAPRAEPQELVIPAGPLKKFEFKKGGENFWQELSQEELEEDAAEQLQQQTRIESADANEQEDSSKPKPDLIGKVDMENTSNLAEDGMPQCVVCLDNPGCMVVLPCAHGSVCEACVTRIAQNRAFGGAHCPHCRSAISTIVKIHELDGEMAKGIEFRIPMARAVG
eukprot:TRINITY_DN53745_c0_g1_i1.p1 TRINITY_DN53745_c0_g1~~TRINITY_DN53745_c0_g1_i1.p1  ORF type:complete len:299 (-),score=48.11 TRINITY_DN53745_c0_g1_i1:70-966(-)